MGVPQLADLVLETANAPGTGAFTLGGAPDGRQTFADAFPNGGDVYYYASDGVQSEWGVGTLTVGSPNVLVRKTIIGNLFGTTSALNFTSGVTVYCEVPAKKTPSLDDDGQLPVSGSPDFTRDVALSAKVADARYLMVNSPDEQTVEGPVNYASTLMITGDNPELRFNRKGTTNWSKWLGPDGTLILQRLGSDGSYQADYIRYLPSGEIDFAQPINCLSDMTVEGKAAFGGAITVQNATDSANPVSLGQLNDRISLELPVGIPQAWPLDTPPSGWLILNGASFDVTQYPKLAIAFPSGVLPDMRGKFIRGWDNGAALDPNDGQVSPGDKRALLSTQEDALQNITGQTFNGYRGILSAFSGAFTPYATATHTAIAKNLDWGGQGGVSNYNGVNFDASLVARTSTETRPTNMAWNMIVRAA
ncbi:phage tail protein [Acetobacter ghanensis]|uniref:phage tail protein n=1 Tax=Acetobacter ghanensis TaxID=431306 RepID=UPI003D327C9F